MMRWCYGSIRCRQPVVIYTSTFFCCCLNEAEVPLMQLPFCSCWDLKEPTRRELKPGMAVALWRTQSSAVSTPLQREKTQTRAPYSCLVGKTEDFLSSAVQPHDTAARVYLRQDMVRTDEAKQLIHSVGLHAATAFLKAVTSLYPSTNQNLPYMWY